MRVGFDFLAKVADVGVQCPAAALDRVTESSVEQFPAGKDMTGFFLEKLNDIKAGTTQTKVRR